MKKLVIVDASVLLTALFDTNDRVATRLDRLLHDTTSKVFILPYTAVEFANGVRFSTRSIDIAKDALKKFINLALTAVDFTLADVASAIELSYRLDTTVYDTAYHHVAIIQDGTFITCDRSYYRKAHQLSHIELWE